MNTIEESLKYKLSRIKEKHLYRNLYPLDNRKHNEITFSGKRYVNFASNDYLCLATYSKVIDSYIEGATLYGFGSSSSPLITGYYNHSNKLEERFSKFLNREKALLFNSGYHSNIGIFESIATRHTSIYSDRLCHASIIDGIKLSGARHFRFFHNDTGHLESILSKDNSKQKIIVTESIFSMEGDLSPIKEIVQLSDKYGAFLIVDDAHGIGVLGKSGGGILEELGLSINDVPLIIIPLGKAFGGMGSIVAGNHEIIDSLKNSARSYIYSTALPPAISHTLSTVIDIVEQEGWRRNKLNELISFFINECYKRNISLCSYSFTPIKSVLIKDNNKALLLQDYLRERGFWVTAIRPPTIPENTSRIRISLNCLHETSEIVELLDFIYCFLKNE